MTFWIQFWRIFQLYPEKFLLCCGKKFYLVSVGYPIIPCSWFLKTPKSFQNLNSWHLRISMIYSQWFFFFCASNKRVPLGTALGGICSKGTRTIYLEPYIKGVLRGCRQCITKSWVVFSEVCLSSWTSDIDTDLLNFLLVKFALDSWWYWTFIFFGKISWMRLWRLKMLTTWQESCFPSQKCLICCLFLIIFS